MKPRPNDEIRRLRTNIEKLTSAIRHSIEETQQAQLEREKLLQEQWRLQRESATHKRSAEDYDTLLAENEHLTRATQEVKTALHNILDWSKTASGELRR